MAEFATSYCIHGVRVRSEAVIPAWPTGAGGAQDEWLLRFDDVASDLHAEALVRAGDPRWWWSGDPSIPTGTLALTITGGDGAGSAARLAVDWSRRTVTASYTHADNDGLRGCIELVNRWILPIIARHERSAFPVHATSLEIGGRALLLCGDSGTGKSTLAGALGQRGGRVLGDEPVLVEARGAGVIVWPGESSVRLHADSAAAVGGVSGMRADGPRFGKALLLPDAEHDGSHAVPLLAVCALQPRHDGNDGVRVEPLAPVDAVALLMANRYAAFGVPEFVRMDFAAACRLADTASFVRVSMPDDLGRLATSAAELVGVVEAMP